MAGARAIRALGLATLLALQPTFTLPIGWVPLLGGAAMELAAHAADSWLISVRIPARARAGTYSIPLGARDAAGRPLLRDSIAVDIGEKHAVVATLTEHPSYAVSAEPYRVGIIVQNRGNVDAHLVLAGSSSLGGAVTVPPSLSLAPDESRLVRVGVRTEITGQQSEEDITTIRVGDAADTVATALVRSRVTLVQHANAREPLHTLASTLRLRAAGAATGVSPFELVANGALRDGGPERVDVVMRSRLSPGYSLGDQEEYRVAVTGTHYRAQLGDAVYNSSVLTSTGQRGSGAGLDMGDSTFGANGYVQSFRFQPVLGSERGAGIRYGPTDRFGAPLFGVSTVLRNGAIDAGSITTATARLHPAAGMALDVELGSSRASDGTGSARAIRFRGGSFLHVDAGHRAADPQFAGYTRGSVSDFVGLNTEAWRKLQLSASGNSYRRSISGQDGAPRTMQRSSLLEIRYDGRYSLGYVDQARTASFLLRSPLATNRGVIARIDQPAGLTHLFGSVEAGSADDGAGSRMYDQLSAGVTTTLGPHTLSLYGQSSQGAAILRGAERLLSVGMDVQAQLPWRTIVALTASRTRTTLPSTGYAQVDARLGHTLASGASVAMRIRGGGYDFDGVTSAQRQAYLEYSLPLRLPVGPSRSTGRVRGRVVDQGTGRGLPGALVRLGPQAAITDEEGRVAFAGLPAGDYRLTLAQQPVSGTTVFNGNPNVRVDATSHSPADFHVAVEAGGIIEGDVRRMVVVRTGLEAGTDSLGDGGALEGLTIELSGARDTLYRTTAQAGGFQFTDIPSGTWTVRVVSEPGEQTEWIPDRASISVGSGERKSLGFRLKPKRRKVRIMSGDGVIEG